MFFLCTPVDLGAGWAAVLITIILFVALINPLFMLFLHLDRLVFKKLDLRDYLYKIVVKEMKWIWAILALIGLSAPILVPFFFLPIVMMISFPIYFTFNFILLLFSKSSELPESSRKFLAFYYSVPTFIIILLGSYAKLKLYGNFHTLLRFYTQEEQKNYFIIIFISLIVMFIVFWLYHSNTSQENFSIKTKELEKKN